MAIKDIRGSHAQASATINGTATLSSTSFVNTGQVSLTNLGSGGTTVTGIPWRLRAARTFSMPLSTR